MSKCKIMYKRNDADNGRTAYKETFIDYKFNI